LRKEASSQPTSASAQLAAVPDAPDDTTLDDARKGVLPGGGVRGDVEPVSALEAIAELARIDFARNSVQEILGQIAQLARAALTPQGEVSVTLLGPTANTAAWTGPLAVELDRCQYESGKGPCVDAAAAGENLLIEDTSVEQRWPLFADAARAAGLASMLSLTLPVQDGITGALNVYSWKSGGFDASALELGRTFAAYAAVAVGNAHLYNDASTQARQMREAMEHRAVIEQAKGILMRDRRCTAEEAFDVLRELSNTTNRKMRDVAALLVAETTRQVR
jgi:GAF domain-containing protein